MCEIMHETITEGSKNIFVELNILNVHIFPYIYVCN